MEGVFAREQLTLAQVAVKAAISRSQVVRVLERYQVARRPPGPPRRPAAAAGQLFGLGAGAVTVILDRHGMARRRPGRPRHGTLIGTAARYPPAPAPPGGAPVVRWHCRASQIPAPPSPTGSGRAAAWAYLSSGRLRLTAAIGLPGLLTKAVPPQGPALAGSSAPFRHVTERAASQTVSRVAVC
jgi:hypothetical protein